MSRFEAIRDARGAPMLACTCDGCGAREEVRAAHGKAGTEGQGQAITKLAREGWSYIGKRLLCPACEAKRKEPTMKVMKTGAGDGEVRTPTLAQRRQIMELLTETYDVGSGKYRSGETDASVASVIEGCMPGWVAEVRENFFGPEGTNDDIEALIASVNELRSSTMKAIEVAELAAKQARGQLSDLSVMQADLDRIKRAVGPHVLAKAGVK